MYYYFPLEACFYYCETERKSIQMAGQGGKYWEEREECRGYSMWPKKIYFQKKTGKNSSYVNSGSKYQKTIFYKLKKLTVHYHSPLFKFCASILSTKLCPQPLKWECLTAQNHIPTGISVPSSHTSTQSWKNSMERMEVKSMHVVRKTVWVF